VRANGRVPIRCTVSTRTAGYYVNFIFEAPPKAIAELDAKFPMEADVFRWQITEPMPEMPEREPRMKAEAEAKMIRE
jgi:ribosomal protein S6